VESQRADEQIMKSEHQRLSHEQLHMTEKIKDNTDKIENNRQLPYLVGMSMSHSPSDGTGNVIEILDMDTADGAEEEGACLSSSRY
jgi:26S proteasome regulatory subunit T5